MSNEFGRHFITLGMFIIDEFEFLDEAGKPTGKVQDAQIGGGGTYAAIGARIWLPAQEIGMIVDRGNDFPKHVQQKLDSYGSDMWHFRDDPERHTTRALNLYQGEHRGFEYLTPRVRLTPRDLQNTKLSKPRNLHFICSPTRAAAIMSEVREVDGWNPVTIYEPIPDRCIPEELPSLISVLPSISILSPNSEEALSLLSMPQPPTKELIEDACNKFLEFGVGKDGQGHVIIRSGAMGSYVASRQRRGMWIDAYWSSEKNLEKIVDVTGAGNSFLGGLAGGLLLSGGDIFEAAFYATISASFTIEQLGLPNINELLSDGGRNTRCNDDNSFRRLDELRARSRERET